MNDQMRDLCSTKLNNERAERSLIGVEMELGEQELSNVSGGSLHLACVKGEHIKRAKLTC